ncbi:MAG: hypothetical protein WCR61_03495 [Bacteroidales bacterium]|nr:hypothetical protein [Bacteroidales bacterium]
MKKLFLLFAVAGFVLTSCGGNAQEQTEQKAVEQADSTAANAADSTSCCSGDSTETTDAVQE